MELTIESIQEVEDPYQTFVDSIKNKETFRKYKSHLYRFLKLVPNSIYSENIGHTPFDDSIETLSRFFVQLAEKDPKIARNVITAFIKEDRKQVEGGNLSPSTFPTHIKPIRRLLDANDIALHWKSIQRLYPRGTVSKDRAYTREELQKMMDAVTDLTDKVIILVSAAIHFPVYIYLVRKWAKKWNKKFEN